MCHSQNWYIFFHLFFFLPLCHMENQKIHRTLNNNNITALPREIFSGMPRIRALRLSDNPFTCDCHLSWLSRYLRNSPRLAPYTRCHSPSQLKGQGLAELHEHDFKCSGKSNSLFVSRYQTAHRLDQICEQPYSSIDFIYARCELFWRRRRRRREAIPGSNL